jgi:hypothetical protein
MQQQFWRHVREGALHTRRHTHASSNAQQVKKTDGMQPRNTQAEHSAAGGVQNNADLGSAAWMDGQSSCC